MNGSGRQHDLAGHDRLAVIAAQLDPDGAFAFDENANDGLPGENGHAA